MKKYFGLGRKNTLCGAVIRCVPITIVGRFRDFSARGKNELFQSECANETTTQANMEKQR